LQFRPLRRTVCSFSRESPSADASLALHAIRASRHPPHRGVQRKIVRVQSPARCTASKIPATRWTARTRRSASWQWRALRLRPADAGRTAMRRNVSHNHIEPLRQSGDSGLLPITDTCRAAIGGHVFARSIWKTNGDTLRTTRVSWQTFCDRRQIRLVHCNRESATRRDLYQMRRRRWRTRPTGLAAVRRNHTRQQRRQQRCKQYCAPVRTQKRTTYRPPAQN